MTLLLEYKWNQLKSYVFLQNIILMSYVIYFIMVKIKIIDDRIALLIFTIIIMVPEIKQNYDTFKSLLDKESETEFGFEDI